MIRAKDLFGKNAIPPVKLIGKPFELDRRGRALESIPADELESMCLAAKIDPARVLPIAAACYAGAATKAKANAARQAMAGQRLEAMRGDLYAKQSEAVRKFIADEYAAILFKPGVGKTRTMLELIHLRAHPKIKVLWVCPRQVFHSIERELRTPRYAHYSHVVCSGTSSKQKLEKLTVASRNFYLMNYHSALNDQIIATIAGMNFDVVVLDESHSIASARNAWTKALMSISDRFKTRFIMTGTFAARPTDVFAQVTFLDHGELCGLDFYKWQQRAVAINEYTRKQSFINGWQERVDDWLRRHAVFATLSDVVDMPEPIRHQIEVELSAAEAKAYEEMRKDFLLVLDDKELTAEQKITQLNFLRQITGGGVYVKDDKDRKEARIVGASKLDALVEFLAEYPDEPVLISHAYTMEAPRIAEACRKAGRKVGVLNGGTSDSDSAETCRAFAAGELGAVVMQANKGVGIDGLQDSCKILVHFSRVFGWRANEQLEGRLVRGGQRHAVLIVELLATVVAADEERATVDSFVLESVQAGYDTAADIIKAIRGKI